MNCPFSVVTGNENISPAGISYVLPSVNKPADYHYSLPLTKSLMWSIAADAAEAADEAPLNSIISAPRF